VGSDAGHRPVKSQGPMQQAVRDMPITLMAATPVSSMPNRVVIVPGQFDFRPSFASLMPFGIGIENPQRTHSNVFAAFADGWPIVRTKVIGRPQTTQVTLGVGALGSAIRRPLSAAACRGLDLSEFTGEASIDWVC
jgi:hypothetical protein